MKGKYSYANFFGKIYYIFLVASTQYSGIAVILAVKGNMVVSKMKYNE